MLFRSLMYSSSAPQLERGRTTISIPVIMEYSELNTHISMRNVSTLYICEGAACDTVVEIVFMLAMVPRRKILYKPPRPEHMDSTVVLLPVPLKRAGRAYDS